MKQIYLARTFFVCMTSSSTDDLMRANVTKPFASKEAAQQSVLDFIIDKLNQDDCEEAIAEFADNLELASRDLDIIAHNIKNIDFDKVCYTFEKICNDNDTHFGATIESFNVPTDETENTTTLLNTQIRDWRLSDGHDEDEVPENAKGTYRLTIEKTGPANQIFFSIHDEVLTTKGYPLGLHGFIEIRDGVPAISLGISPDDNIIHIMSNNTSELAVIKEFEGDKPTWGEVSFSEHGHNGLVFDVDYSDTVFENRIEIAQLAYESKMKEIEAPLESCTLGSWSEVENEEGLFSVVSYPDGSQSTVTVQFHDDSFNVESVKFEEVKTQI